MFKKLLLTASIICSLLRMLQAQTGNIIIPDGNASMIDHIIVDKQGKYVYTIDGSKIVMWDIKTGDQLYSFPGTDEITQIAISNDGTKLAVGNSTIVCYDTYTGKELFTNTENYYGGGISFSADDKQLYAIYSGLSVIDVNSNKASKIFYNSDFKDYHAQALTLSNGYVAIANNKGWEIWDPLNKKQIFKKELGTEYLKVDFHQVLNYVVYSNDDTFDFYDILSGKLVKSIPNVTLRGVFIASTNSNEFLLNADAYTNAKLLIYNGNDFTLKSTIPTSVETRAIAFQGVGQHVFVGAPGKTLQYKTGSSKVVRELAGKIIRLGAIAPSYSNLTGKMTLVSNGTAGKLIDMTRMVTIAGKNLGLKPNTACFSVTGDTVAIFDYKSVTIKNLRSGAVILPAKPIGMIAEYDPLQSNGYFFSNDGKALYYIVDMTKTFPQRLMKMDMVTKVITPKVEFNGITSLNVSADRQFLEVIQSSGEGEGGFIIDIATGKTIFQKALPKTDASGNYNEPMETFICLSRDRKKVIFAHQDVFSIFNFPSGTPILENEKITHLDKFGTNASNSDLSKIVTADRDGSFFVLSVDGKKEYSVFKAHNSAITNIMFSLDDKVFYTFSYDGNIKTWNAENGELLGTLYLFNDGLDYVFVNEDGRFDGTPDGIKELYYFVKRQKIPLDIVYERFYTPNLYARLLNGERFEPISILFTTPPKVKMTYASKQRNLEVDDDQPTYQNETGAAEITVTATAIEDKIDEIRLFHNGKIVTLTSRNLIVADADNEATITKKYNLNLLPGVNSVRALALNSQRTESQPDNITINYKRGNAPIPVSNPAVAGNGVIASVDKTATLYLIVVGINAYDNASMSLNYALADATAFKSEIEKDAKSIITNVKTYFVTDKEADKNGILTAFNQVQQNAKAQDVFIFYYAGHGVIGKDKEFYLVPKDVSDLKNVQAELESKGIPAKLLQQYAVEIQAQKQLFILDACQSAGAFDEMLSASGDQQKSIAVVSRSTGTHWMAASGAQQYANEFSQLGHGAFTYVLLQALKGSAASNKMITVNGLKNYIQLEVPALMKKYSGTLQYPASYGFGNDFPVEVIK